MNYVSMKLFKERKKKKRVLGWDYISNGQQCRRLRLSGSQLGKPISHNCTRLLILRTHLRNHAQVLAPHWAPRKLSANEMQHHHCLVLPSTPRAAWLLSV